MKIRRPVERRIDREWALAFNSGVQLGRVFVQRPPRGCPGFGAITAGQRNTHAGAPVNPAQIAPSASRASVTVANAPNGVGSCPDRSTRPAYRRRNRPLRHRRLDQQLADGEVPQERRPRKASAAPWPHPDRSAGECHKRQAGWTSGLGIWISRTAPPISAHGDARHGATRRLHHPFGLIAQFKRESLSGHSPILSQSMVPGFQRRQAARVPRRPARALPARVSQPFGMPAWPV